MAKTKEQLELEILEAQHKAALLNLDELLDTNAQRQQAKAVKLRVNEERQRGFKTLRDGREVRFMECSHRQGGKLGQLKARDTNQSALMVMKMPDDFTTIIYCLICKVPRVSPHPYLRRTMPFPAGFHVTATGIVLEKQETPAQVRERLIRFAWDTERFNALLELSRDKLVEVPVMDCGTVHHLTRSDTGERVYPWRQSDMWPYEPAGYALAMRQRPEVA